MDFELATTATIAVRLLARLLFGEPQWRIAMAAQHARASLRMKSVLAAVLGANDFGQVINLLCPLGMESN